MLRYDEGLLIGYRGYDRAGTVPLFPFGHGLGYTTWAYDALAAAAPGGHLADGADLELVVTIRNTGTRPGKEVVQAYLAAPAGEPARPLRTLAAFAAVSLGPGETAQVPLRIPARAFARWDEASGGWTAVRGEFTVQAGRSARDLPLSLSVTR